MSYHLGVIHAGTDDVWAAIRLFVDDSGLRRALDAADQIEFWLSLDMTDSAFDVFYEAQGCRFWPPDGRLRCFLSDVRHQLLSYSDAKLHRALAKHSDLSRSYVRHLMLTFAEGERLLGVLPSQLHAAKQRWGLDVGAPLAGGRKFGAWVTTEAGDPAVLRVGRGVDSATMSLRSYDGEGAVRLLDSFDGGDAVLLERVRPGRPLSELVATDDERATEVFADLLEVLWRPVPAPPPGVDPAQRSGWVVPIGGRMFFDVYAQSLSYRGLLPPGLVVDAARVMGELLASMSGDLLLHGDLHHGHILSSDRSRTGWLAIDPLPFHGEPAYDLGPLFYSPTPWLAEVADLPALLRRRASQVCARLSLDEERVKAWAFVRAMFAEVLTVQSAGKPNGGPLRVASELRQMI
jgi:streptomycin 6-kinase